MNRIWPTVQLGEVCKFERGVSPTLQTEPGPYPLVVTASYRRSSADFQFDQPAVCIPLVSSTGHGNAAIHRIHYQEGKFALANILVALIPHELSLINAKFLWRYLSATKDKILVPLMQGTANVSLKEHDIYNVSVPIPQMAEQKRIIAHLDAIENRLARVKKLREEQLVELNAALVSAFHRLETKGDWVEMAELAPVHRRPTELNPEGKYPELGVRSFGKGIFHKPTLLGDSLTWQKLFRVHEGDIVISNIKAWEGAIAVAGKADHGRFGSHRYLTCVTDVKHALPEYVCFYLLTDSGLEQIGNASPGSADRNRTLAVKRLQKIKIPIVTIEEQYEFKKLLDLRNNMKREALEVNNQIESLVPSLLDRIFNH